MVKNIRMASEQTTEEHIDGGSKRSRTFEFDHPTSDARVGFDLNDDVSVQVSPTSRPKVKNQRQSQRQNVRLI